jgi:hypothetical protein
VRHNIGISDSIKAEYAVILTVIIKREENFGVNAQQPAMLNEET